MPIEEILPIEEVVEGPKRVAVVDQNGNIQNVILLDPKSEWTPPEGTTIVEDVTGSAEPGGKHESGVFVSSIREVPNTAITIPAITIHDEIEEIKRRLDALEGKL